MVPQILSAFVILFLEHCRLFCVNWMYGCQDMGKSVNSMIFKLGLRYYLFYFWTIGGYISSIGGTIAKILLKMLIFWF